MKILSVAIALLVVSTIKGQSDRSLINFRSFSSSLCLTPAHGAYFATRMGEVAVPAGQPGVWQHANPEKGTGYLGKPLLDNINFFNKDTGFVSGFIQDSNRIYNIYYYTTDGGRRWSKRRFADAGWADMVVHLNNGKAWASISGSGHIDYSPDYGMTWQQLNVPHANQRYAAIFFDNRNEGLIGSLWNALDYTSDNGKTWLDIPTPLAQHAYNKTDINNRPEFNRVAIFQSYLIVEQEGLVFASPKDSIHWKSLPYDGFIADNNTGTLFFTSKNTVTRVGSDLSPLVTYPVNGGRGMYNNGQLAMWDGNLLTTINDDGAIASTRLYSDEAEVLNPAFIGFDSAEGFIGCNGNTIYTQRNEGAWKQKAKLPFSVEGRSLKMTGKDTLLVTGAGDSLLYYSFITGQSIRTTGSALIARFCSGPVQKVVFEIGSQGCFHFYNDRVIYERDGDQFVLADNESSGSAHKEKLSDCPDDLPAAIVDSFVRHLPAALSAKPTISTIGITAKDIDRCRKAIWAFRDYVKTGKPNRNTEEKGFRLNENNIDFDRLLSSLDSVMSMRPSTVDSLLYNMSNMWSTTSNWTGIRFELSDGTELSIMDDFVDPNSLHFPWIVSIKGYAVPKNTIAVNRFVEKVYPGFILKESHEDVVGRFVKHLYHGN